MFPRRIRGRCLLRLACELVRCASFQGRLNALESLMHLCSRSVTLRTIGLASFENDGIQWEKVCKARAADDGLRPVLRT